jgi:hypothetical protein
MDLGFPIPVIGKVAPLHKKSRLPARLDRLPGDFYRSENNRPKYVSEIIFPENIFFIKLSHFLSRLAYFRKAVTVQDIVFCFFYKDWRGRE